MVKDSVPDDIMNIQNNLRLYLALIIIFNFIIIFYLKLKHKALEKFKEFSKSAKNKEVLLIIPKMEDLLYFYPTIKTLVSQEYILNILSIVKTKEEIKQSVTCVIKGCKIYCCDNDKLKDNSFSWEEETITNEINEYLNNNENIGTIITFDELGYGNNKCIACYNGFVKYLLNNKQKIKDSQIQIYNIDTFCLLNLISFLFPAIYFYFKLYGFYNSNFTDVSSLLKALNFGYGRKLFQYASSNTYFNSLTKIEFKE